MTNDQAQGEGARTDFFISYTGKDRTWAEWIAWHLEEAGYSTVLQAWDFHAGGNFVLDTNRPIGSFLTKGYNHRSGYPPQAA